MNLTTLSRKAIGISLTALTAAVSSCSLPFTPPDSYSRAKEACWDAPNSLIEETAAEMRAFRDQGYLPSQIYIQSYNDCMVGAGDRGELSGFCADCMGAILDYALEE